MSENKSGGDTPGTRKPARSSKTANATPTAVKKTAAPRATATDKAAKKSTVAKPASKKLAAAKADTTQPATPRRKAAPAKPALDPELRQRLINDTAYYLSEKRRHFVSAEDDWCFAEGLIAGLAGALLKQ